MAQVQIADVVVPAEFTAHHVEDSMMSTALYQPTGERVEEHRRMNPL
jgi:hypothetical protein